MFFFLPLKGTGLLLLTMQNGVSSLVPAADPPSATTQQCVTDLRNKLNRLEDLIAERENLLKEILSATDADEVTHSLMDQENPQSIVDQELDKFKSVEAEIQRNIEEQKTLLEDLAVSPFSSLLWPLFSPGVLIPLVGDQ